MKFIFNNLYDKLEDYDSFNRIKNDYFVIDWNEINKEIEEIKKGNESIALVINIQDSWTYDDMNKVIKEIESKKEYKDVKIFITTKGKDIFRTEKYLQPLERWLSENGYDFEIVGIPLCYAQDFIEKHHDTKVFLKEKELAFNKYHYFEDCRFCKLRGICPGALEHYEDDVYATFKDAEKYYNYEPRIVDKKTINEIALKQIEPKSKVWIIPLGNISEEELKILIYALKKLNVEITFGLKIDESLIKICEKLGINPFKPKGRYAYKTLDDKKILRVLVEVDLFDSLIIITNTNEYQKIVYDLIHEGDLRKFELNNETQIQLFNAIKHKIHLIYVEKSLISNPNSPQLS